MRLAFRPPVSRDFKCPRCPARVAYPDQFCDGCHRQWWIEQFENKMLRAKDDRRINAVIRLMGKLEKGRLL